MRIIQRVWNRDFTNCDITDLKMFKTVYYILEWYKNKCLSFVEEPYRKRHYIFRGSKKYRSQKHNYFNYPHCGLKKEYIESMDKEIYPFVHKRRVSHLHHLFNLRYWDNNYHQKYEYQSDKRCWKRTKVEKQYLKHKRKEI